MLVEIVYRVFLGVSKLKLVVGNCNRRAVGIYKNSRKHEFRVNVGSDTRKTLVSHLRDFSVSLAEYNLVLRYLASVVGHRNGVDLTLERVEDICYVRACDVFGKHELKVARPVVNKCAGVRAVCRAAVGTAARAVACAAITRAAVAARVTVRAAVATDAAGKQHCQHRKKRQERDNNPSKFHKSFFPFVLCDCITVLSRAIRN